MDATDDLLALAARTRDHARWQRAMNTGHQVLVDLATGTRIAFESEGSTVTGEFLRVAEWVQRNRVVDYAVVIKPLTGEEIAYTTSMITGVRLAPAIKDECAGFVLDAATAGRKVERCLCGLRRDMH